MARPLLLLIAVSCIMWVQLTMGCTYFEVRGSGSEAPTVLANTMESFKPERATEWQVGVRPKGTAFKPFCEGGSAWQAALGYVAMSGSAAAATGGRVGDNSMNEAGLSISSHALRGVATYRPANTTHTVCSNDFALWAVSTFRTVSELRKELTSTQVLIDGPGTTSTPGLQWAIADASGESIVVDHLTGELHVYNNSGVGVLTNDPEYPWQVKNLNNYAGLSWRWPAGNDAITVDSEFGKVPVPVSHGQNMLGLPGDLSPPSRFVRTFYTRAYALLARPPQSLDDVLVLTSSVLNTQHIVQGFNARLPTSEAGYDYTQFAVMKVPSERLFYYRSYEAAQWRLVNLTKVDFTRKGDSKPSGGFAAMDITGEL